MKQISSYQTSNGGKSFRTFHKVGEKQTLFDFSLVYNGAHGESISKGNWVRATTYRSSESHQYRCLQPLNPYSHHSPGRHLLPKACSRQHITFKPHRLQLQNHQSYLERLLHRWQRAPRLHPRWLQAGTLINLRFKFQQLLSQQMYYQPTSLSLPDTTRDTPELVAALRGDPVLYQEVLQILSKKGVFKFHSVNTLTRNIALPSSFKGIERIHIK